MTTHKLDRLIKVLRACLPPSALVTFALFVLLAAAMGTPLAA